MPSNTNHTSDIKHIEILRIEPYLRRNKYKLHAAFLDATMIAEIDKPVEFEISIGNFKPIKYSFNHITTSMCFFRHIESNVLIIEGLEKKLLLKISFSFS